jgi:hypothetical protein
MQSGEIGNLSQLRAKKIKLAVECTCELCREYLPHALLEIHSIGRSPRSTARERDLLVVCSHCHRHIHELPVPVSRQRALVRSRSIITRSEIREILRKKFRTYSPPDNFDYEELYRELSNPGSIVHNGT